MSRSVNRVILVGNVGASPEIRTTSTGKMVASVSLATNRSWKDANGERQEKTEWHRLNAWNKLAQFFEDYVKKGDRIYVEGSLEYDSYERDDGVTIPTAEIHVKEMVLLSPKREPSEPSFG